MALKNNKGQAFIESIMSIPVFILTVGLVLVLLYEQFQLQVIEHLMHEGLLCETAKSNLPCLAEANKKANAYFLLGKVLIQATGKQEWSATLYLLKGFKWKTLTIKQN